MNQFPNGKEHPAGRRTDRSELDGPRALTELGLDDCRRLVDIWVCANHRELAAPVRYLQQQQHIAQLHKVLKVFIEHGDIIDLNRILQIFLVVAIIPFGVWNTTREIDLVLSTVAIAVVVGFAAPKIVQTSFVLV